jgi:ABC-type transport system involved in multi-copper enzyme maturation permease subunit
MRKAGGIISIIAGIFGVLAAGATLFIGGLGGAFESDGASTVVGLGWGGVLFSFIVIILGAVCIGSKTKKPGIFLVIASILGAILGGTLVALFMILSFIGGILALFGKTNVLDELDENIHAKRV